MKCFSLSLLSGLLVSTGLLVYSPGSLMAQADKKEGNKKIVVIYKGGSKDPAAKISLDGNDQGALAPEKFLEISTGDGNHTVIAGEGSSRNVRCSRQLGGSGQLGTSSTSFDHIDVSFNPAELKLDLKDKDAIYLQLERFKPPTLTCDELERKPDQFSEYKLREIKAEDGQKLVKKYSK